MIFGEVRDNAEHGISNVLANELKAKHSDLKDLEVCRCIFQCQHPLGAWKMKRQRVLQIAIFPAPSAEMPAHGIANEMPAPSAEMPTLSSKIVKSIWAITCGVSKQLQVSFLLFRPAAYE